MTISCPPPFIRMISSALAFELMNWKVVCGGNCVDGAGEVVVISGSGKNAVGCENGKRFN